MKQISYRKCDFNGLGDQTIHVFKVFGHVFSIITFAPKFPAHREKVKCSETVFRLPYLFDLTAHFRAEISTNAAS